MADINRLRLKRLLAGKREEAFDQLYTTPR
jgi:hypothetical protein